MTTIVEGTFNTCVNLEKVNLGYGVKTIESGAFYRCESLKTIIMPSNVNQIGETAFEYVGGFTIYGEPGSYAQAYANSYDRPFMPIDSLGEPPAVTSASASKSTLVAGESVTFTVKTPSAAKYLAMYSETGAKAKTWPAVENSTVSNNVRTWKVTYAIKTAGSRRLTFKASIDTLNMETAAPYPLRWPLPRRALLPPLPARPPWLPRPP